MIEPKCCAPGGLFVFFGISNLESVEKNQAVSYLSPLDVHFRCTSEMVAEQSQSMGLKSGRSRDRNSAG
jgi:hypothetical protein